MEIDFLFAVAAFVIFIVWLVIFFNKDARVKIEAAMCPLSPQGRAE